MRHAAYMYVSRLNGEVQLLYIGICPFCVIRGLDLHAPFNKKNNNGILTKEIRSNRNELLSYQEYQ